jgi:hypothetical protein
MSTPTAAFFCKVLVIDVVSERKWCAGSVTAALILLRLEFEVPAADPDVRQSCNSRDIVAIVVYAFHSRLVSPTSARGAPSFFCCESPHFEFLPFPFRSLAELSCIWLAVKR